MTPRTPRAQPDAVEDVAPVADHFETLTRTDEERYELTHGPLRSVVAEVVGKFLDCGFLEQGFACVRCAECRAEFLVSFGCKGRRVLPLVPGAAIGRVEPVVGRAPARPGSSFASFGSWGDVFGDRVFAAAILDRVLHHAVTVYIRGSRHRLKDKLKSGIVQAPTEAVRRSPAVGSSRCLRVGRFGCLLTDAAHAAGLGADDEPAEVLGFPRARRLRAKPASQGDGFLPR